VRPGRHKRQQHKRQTSNDIIIIIRIKTQGKGQFSPNVLFKLLCCFFVVMSWCSQKLNDITSFLYCYVYVVMSLLWAAAERTCFLMLQTTKQHIWKILRRDLQSRFCMQWMQQRYHERLFCRDSCIIKLFETYRQNH